MNPTEQNIEVGRKNPAAGVRVQFGESNIVLLTVTTEKREPWLANSLAEKFLKETWQQATAWMVGDYLLMPDHLHAFCAPRDFSFSIEDGLHFGSVTFDAGTDEKNGVLNLVAGITGFEMAKNTPPSGFIFKKAPFARGLWKKLKTGLTRVQSIISDGNSQ